MQIFINRSISVIADKWVEMRGTSPFMTLHGSCGIIVKSI